MVYRETHFQNYHIFFNTSKYSFEVYDAWFHRSKDFEAIKAGKSAIRPWLVCQYNESTLVDLPSSVVPVVSMKNIFPMYRAASEFIAMVASGLILIWSKFLCCKTFVKRISVLLRPDQTIKCLFWPPLNCFFKKKMVEASG